MYRTQDVRTRLGAGGLSDLRNMQKTARAHDCVVHGQKKQELLYQDIICSIALEPGNKYSITALGFHDTRKRNALPQAVPSKAHRSLAIFLPIMYGQRF